MPFYSYLFFSGGQCRDAFTTYQRIFGGELEIMTHAELPDGAEPMPGAEPSDVMHAALKIGDALLMGSDDPTGDGGAKVGIAVCHSASDEATAKQVFDALAEGGEITMPFESTFWSSGFGSCNDRFGIPWMVDVATPPEAG